MNYYTDLFDGAGATFLSISAGNAEIVSAPNGADATLDVEGVTTRDGGRIARHVASVAAVVNEFTSRFPGKRVSLSAYCGGRRSVVAQHQRAATIAARHPDVVRVIADWTKQV